MEIAIELKKKNEIKTPEYGQKSCTVSHICKENQHSGFGCSNLNLLLNMHHQIWNKVILGR